MTKRKAPGFSFLETIISLFLVTGVILLVTSLFHTSTRYAKESAQTQKASLILEKQVSLLREWSSTKAGAYNYDSLPSRDGESLPDRDDGAFLVTLNVADAPLMSPCSELESRFAPPTGQRVCPSFQVVDITVSWGGGSKSSVTGSTLIGDPARVPAASVEVTPSTISDLAIDGTASFSAVLKDTDGNPIPGVCFGWYIDCYGGSADIVPDRTGRTAVLTNRAHHADGTWIHTGGSIKLVAWTKYRGTEIRGETNLIGLLK